MIRPNCRIAPIDLAAASLEVFFLVKTETDGIVFSLSLPTSQLFRHYFDVTSL